MDQKGSNPFIHSCMYPARLPRCVQNACATLSSYLHKAKFREEMVFQIIKESASQLLADHGVHLEGIHENLSMAAVTLDCLKRIAPMQALLFY